MKYDVMIKILMKLLTRKKVTAKELSEQYEVSQRSIYRYLDDLTVSGVPVNIERGRYGGISIADTYRLPAGFLTSGEYISAINAINAMSHQINDPDLMSAKEKLESRYKSDKQNSSVCGNVIVDGGTWGGSKVFSEKMKICEQAVNECKSLLIDYVSRGGEHSKRVIDAHVLVFKQSVWYVYAYCHTKQQFRTFKIGRIKSACFTGETFEKRAFRREDVDIDFKDAEKALTDVTLKISADSVADAEEWLGIDNLEPLGHDFIATVNLPDDKALVNQILSYGGAVEVLQPEKLKARVKEAARKIAES